MSKAKKLPVEKLSAKVKKAVPVRIVNDTPSCSPKEDNKWRAEEDLRTLQRAKEIKGSKERMTAVKTIADELQRAVK